MKQTAQFAAMLLLVGVMIEGLSLLAGLYLRSKLVTYHAVAGDYRTYLEVRDPVLGWPSPSEFGKSERDRRGTRVSPAFPETDGSGALVSVYGDSFTWGATVDAEHAWGNVLAILLGHRVDNFGVGGYGSDQAYLRFRHNPSDRAPVVVLGHLSENIRRNVNQLRDLLGAPGQIGFKPRLVLDERGRLRDVPLPTLTETEYLDCLEQPARYLPYEAFLPGTALGRIELRFPFTWRAIRSFRHPGLRARLTGEPVYQEFYREDHPAGGLAVTAAILEAFAELARSRQQEPLVLLLPTGLDLDLYATRHGWIYQPLTDRLTQTRRVPFLDVGPAMIEALAGRSPRVLFTRGSLNGHLNAEGNRLLAEIVYEHLVGEGLVEPGRTEGDGGRSSR
jgi:lysophospholipase L1-like esterase